MSAASAAKLPQPNGGTGIVDHDVIVFRDEGGAATWKGVAPLLVTCASTAPPGASRSTSAPACAPANATSAAFVDDGIGAEMTGPLLYGASVQEYDEAVAAATILRARAWIDERP